MIVPGSSSPMLLAIGFAFNATISSDTPNYNLRNAAIAAGWDTFAPLLATVTINSGVYVYSGSTASYAFDTGSSFPVGSSLLLTNNGFIVGAGGNGGIGGNSTNGGGGGGGQGWIGGAGAHSGGNNMGVPGAPGSPGGPALIANAPITIINNGTIAGGGGGGGGSGGDSAPGGTVSGSGTKASFGTGLYGGGNGGWLGASGGAGSYSNSPIPEWRQPGGAGGTGGAAVVGNSKVAWAVAGTRLGAIS